MRPGPIKGGSVRPYIERPTTGNRPQYLHPSLEEEDLEQLPAHNPCQKDSAGPLAPIGRGPAPVGSGVDAGGLLAQLVAATAEPLSDRT